MKHTKKLLALLLSFIMLTSFVGCDLSLPEDDSSSKVDSIVTSIDSTSEDTDVASEQTESTLTDDSSNDTLSSTTSKKTGVKNSVGTGVGTAVNPTAIPAFSGTAYTVVNNNQPNFSASELTTTGYEKYSSLDNLGRCGVAIASCGKETMPGPNEKRGSISSVYPTGWIQKSYSGISGGYLWNRCHLIGWQLSAENANKQNLITGTRYMNVDGMLPFENMVADYIKETGNHVAYRITPIFEGNNLVCSGVQMEAYSIEDKGNGICLNVYCYNVQPGIAINYATGDSSGPTSQTSSKTSNTTSSKTSSVTSTKPTNETTSSTSSVQQSSSTVTQTQSNEMVWIPRTGSKFHRNASCSNMKDPTQVTRQEAESRGYEPCKKCY